MPNLACRKGITAALYIERCTNRSTGNLMWSLVLPYQCCAGSLTEGSAPASAPPTMKCFTWSYRHVTPCGGYLWGHGANGAAIQHWNVERRGEHRESGHFWGRKVAGSYVHPNHLLPSLVWMFCSLQPRDFATLIFLYGGHRPAGELIASGNIWIEKSCADKQKEGATTAFITSKGR